MENQIGQNPVNQPVQIPEKSKINYWMIFTIVLVLILVISSLYTLNLKSQQVSDYKPSITPDNRRTTTPQTPSFVPTQEKELLPPEAWNMYKDKNNVFTLKYPPFLYETRDTYYAPDSGIKDAGALSSVIPYNVGPNKEDDLVIEMSIRPKPPRQTLDGYIETNILTRAQEDTNMDGTVGPPIKIIPDKRKTIPLADGKTAVWLEGIGFMAVSHTEVLIPYRDSEIIYITIWDGTSGKEHKNFIQYEKNMKLAEQIISTFKFVL